MSRTPAGAALLVVALLAFSPLASATAFAPIPTAISDDGPVTWSVEPTPTSDGGRRAFTYEVDPGTQVQDSFLITNAGDTEAEFIIYATDAFNDPDTGNFSLLAHDDPPTDLGAWITPADDKLTIGPGLQATVPFTLLIPSDAAPGDHSAGIVASVLTETQQDGSTVLLEQRVGVRMYMTVSGEAVASVEIQGLTSSFTPSLNPFAPGELTIGYDVRNTGNKRVDVSQAVQVQGIFGIPVGAATPDPIQDLLPRQLVHVNVSISGVAALLYAQSTVKLEPAEVGTVGSEAAAGGSPTPPPTPVPTETSEPTPGATADPGANAGNESAIEYEKVSEQAVTIAISWTLLLLVLLVIAAVVLIRRYVTGTRERMYAAIDEAAEAARLEAAEKARADAAAEKARTDAAAEAARVKSAPKPTAKPTAAKATGAKATGVKATGAKATGAKNAAVPNEDQTP